MKYLELLLLLIFIIIIIYFFIDFNNNYNCINKIENYNNLDIKDKIKYGNVKKYNS